MSFSRHQETHQYEALGWVRARQIVTPSLIVLMSLQLVIPGGLLSSRARFRFTNRRLLCNNRAANCKNAIAAIWTPP